MSPRRRRWLRSGVVALGLFVVAAATGCNGVFYQPDAQRYRPLPAGGEDVWFASGDGTKLHGWFLRAVGKAKGTVVHMHGNAQNRPSAS